ncbi:hypothetical protein EXE53_19655 [Halorubrum sp. SD626R]|uniref:hypothetical protein n=1 Tax=Halorubrum sp. SD626R TaxID=1419722 RepID=UPI0010F7056B|nr:hypothetical protein [Halorubrum sp. SD626R]TKX78734.1 hypothetical protein EXE53_19655 [Halorubrum sp. SD626R]
MSDREWFRAVAAEPVYTAGGEDQYHGPRFPSRSQARSDATRMSSEHNVRTTVVKEPLPDDPSEVFDE